jgi:DNA invertase Pin-like site-specific DNA recombinase
MTLSARQQKRLTLIVENLALFLAESQRDNSKAGAAPKKTRVRRNAEDAVKLRKQIKAERAKGVPAAELAKKFGVSVAYIYMAK